MDSEDLGDVSLIPIVFCDSVFGLGLASFSQSNTANQVDPPTVWYPTAIAKTVRSSTEAYAQAGRLVTAI